MPVLSARAALAGFGLAVLAATGAAPAFADPPGSPGYCPGDGLLHHWSDGQPFAPCPIGGGLVTTPDGNVWIDRHGTAHIAPTAPEMQSPSQMDPGDHANPRPAPVRPGQGQAPGMIVVVPGPYIPPQLSVGGGVGGPP